MFNYIRGRVVHRTQGAVVVENNGIGYKLSIPDNAAAKMADADEEVKLYTYLAVREDGLSLYGFSSAEEQALFEMLVSVSGVGPKAALAVLSTFSPGRFCQAVSHEDTKTLTRIPGIGPKSAKRLVIELKDKLPSLAMIPGETRALTSSAEVFSDVLEALLSLGYNRVEAAAALQSVKSDAGNELDSRELLHLTLGILGGSKERKQWKRE